MTLVPVIGLEVHVQLATRTKMFCADVAESGGDPNTRVCPVCLGLPGALPVPNARAIELAVRAALALGCTVHEHSRFARKNYFYPDLPKGYQITQYDAPLATGGVLSDVRIRRLHLEEDAGKSVHDRFSDATAIDLNRAGVPLIEIVTEPDITSPEAARAFLNRLRQLLRYLDVSECDMEKGSLRVDANVSVRRIQDPPGTKTEVKNLNSFSNVERALAFEIERQMRVVERDGSVQPETLLWDAARGEARAMRSKEESHDYRYFPDPDLPPLVLERAYIDDIARDLPELPLAREARFVTSYDLPAYDAGVLAAERAVADYFEAVVAAGAEPKAASNWVMTEVLAWSNRHDGHMPMEPERLAGLLCMVADGSVSHSAARTVFAAMAESGRSADVIVAEMGLAKVSDAQRIDAWIAAVLQMHAGEAARFRAGDAKVLDFLMGRLMQRSEGKADPQEARRRLLAALRS